MKLRRTIKRQRYTRRRALVNWMDWNRKGE